jgi:hypothetical protein
MYLLQQVSDSEGVPDLSRPAADMAGEHGEQAPGAGRVANKKSTPKNPLKLGFFRVFSNFLFFMKIIQTFLFETDFYEQIRHKLSFIYKK